MAFDNVFGNFLRHMEKYFLINYPGEKTFSIKNYENPCYLIILKWLYKMHIGKTCDSHNEVNI